MSACPSCGQQVDESGRGSLVAMIEKQIKDAPSANPKERPITARDIGRALASLPLMSERLVAFRRFVKKGPKP